MNLAAYPFERLLRPAQGYMANDIPVSGFLRDTNSLVFVYSHNPTSVALLQNQLRFPHPRLCRSGKLRGITADDFLRTKTDMSIDFPAKPARFNILCRFDPLIKGRKH